MTIPSCKHLTSHTKWCCHERNKYSGSWKSSKQGCNCAIAIAPKHRCAGFLQPLCTQCTFRTAQGESCICPCKLVRAFDYTPCVQKHWPTGTSESFAILESLKACQRWISENLEIECPQTCKPWPISYLICNVEVNLVKMVPAISCLLKAVVMAMTPEHL